MVCDKCGYELEPSGLCPNWREHRREIIKNAKLARVKPEAFLHEKDTRQF
jgi:hypothetical protein